MHVTKQDIGQGRSWQT